MAKPVLIALDMNKLELQNAAIQTLASAPSAPVIGQIYFNSVDLQLYIWNGSAWGLVATDAELLNGQAASYYISRANHTGTQLASTISDFDTQVRTSRLDQMAAPIANVSLNGYKITSLLDGTATTDAINKGQLDAAIQGLTNKHTADYATAAALAANTYSNGTSGVGATLTGNSNGALSVDGASPAANDTVLVKDEVLDYKNGLYVVTQAGSGGTPYILTRATEMDTAGEFSGALVAVRTGSTNDGTLWLLNANEPFVVGTTSAVFVHINSAVAFTAGDGIDITGTVITVKLASGGGLQFNGSGEIEVIDVYSDHKYAASIGDGSTQSFTITHNLGTRDITVAVYEVGSPYQHAIVGVASATTNTATITFGTVPTTNQYRVVITG
jgi:hypothetical protein